MKVITEDQVRKLHRTKQIHDGGNYELAEGCLLTPSAQGYLREKRITVVRCSYTEQEATYPAVTTETATEPSQALSPAICDAVEHLIQLLYFPLLPDSFFGVVTWQYIAVQQQNLRDWYKQESKKGLPLKSWLSPEESMCFASCSWRAWQYSAGEIMRQLRWISSLLEGRPEASDFSQWADSCYAFLNNTD